MSDFTIDKLYQAIKLAIENDSQEFVQAILENIDFDNLNEAVALNVIGTILLICRDQDSSYYANYIINYLTKLSKNSIVEIPLWFVIWDDSSTDRELRKYFYETVDENPAKYLSIVAMNYLPERFYEIYENLYEFYKMEKSVFDTLEHEVKSKKKEHLFLMFDNLRYHYAEEMGRPSYVKNDDAIFKGTPTLNELYQLADSPLEDVKIPKILIDSIEDFDEIDTEDLKLLTKEQLLFRIFGESHPNRLLDEIDSPLCHKYGGCRMLLCTCHDGVDHETDVADYEKEWFTGECFECKTKIKHKHWALRIKKLDGGWEGCFDSLECILKNINEEIFNNIDVDKESDDEIIHQKNLLYQDMEFLQQKFKDNVDMFGIQDRRYISQ